MEPIYDEQGHLASVRGKFGYSKDLTLKQWNNRLYVHVNDNSKCWESNTFDKSKSKTISMKWEDAQTLRTRLAELEQFASQFQAWQVTYVIIISFYLSVKI
jgi:hypothetical protein